jgi:hypothetical protein
MVDTFMIRVFSESDIQISLYRSVQNNWNEMGV